HAQFASAHRLAAELPDDAEVYPTHGFGSFCSATQAEASASTIGRERGINPVLILDEQRYVSDLLAGLDAFPAYYAHMGPANAAGGPAGRRLAAAPPAASPGRRPAAGTGGAVTRTAAGTKDGRRPPTAGPFPTPCTSCSTAWPRCPRARCGCIAARDTGPR